jgi:hypothetical protein
LVPSMIDLRASIGKETDAPSPRDVPVDREP